MTPALVGVLCLGLLIASYMRGRGSVHKIGHVVKETIDPPIPDLLVTDAGPGGQNPIRLTRSATAIGKDIEFLSATLLPGRGMNVFQITAMIPGRGEVPLLMAPNVDTVGPQLPDKGDDAHGEASMTMGGAFLLPWAGRLSGIQAGNPGMLQAGWQGQLLNFPALAPGSLNSVDGLFLDRPSTTASSDVLPDGQYAQGVFHPAIDGTWPSTIDVTVTVELSSHTLDLTLSATNTGKTPTPMGIGWHPLFTVPSGDREAASLTIPSTTVLAMNRATGLPTGRTASTDGTRLDFSRAGGTRLGSQDIDEVYTQLQAPGQSSQTAIELRDPAYNLKLRLIPMTANITKLHLIAPADKKWVSIGPNTNVPDAFGPEWQPQETGMVMLAPGASMEWKVRLEIAPISTSETVTH
jgi:aldose 1-epimerase